jgi:hypothetical protein
MELISMDEFFDLAETKPVPLVGPGKLVTVQEHGLYSSILFAMK